MKLLKAVLIEDSRLARNELKQLLKEYAEIEIIGEAENVDDGFKLITKTNPDLLFLDIHMPEKNGFDLLEMLDEVPTTIFTTAFDKYAIKSFEFNAFDYLLKPINPERFSKTIDKILNQKNSKEEIENLIKNKFNSEKQLFIREGEKCWLVKIIDISMFEIVGNYTRVFFENNKALIYKSLIKIEDKLPKEIFFRANRQQIINTNHIKKVETWFNGKLKIELKSGKEIEMSRRQSTIFKERLSF